ncbi:MAG: hypothetical protein CSB33_02550 [Desulfobacterales bacterium]|nr:MAG: hypothetical protein CSB33_02550 [Desulfobacterales bacterium]
MMQISGKYTHPGLGACLRVGRERAFEEPDPAAGTGDITGRNNAGQDTVALSRGLRGGRISNEPDVRMEKIQDVRERIAGGRYEVSPDQVAVQIILEALADGDSE